MAFQKCQLKLHRNQHLDPSGTQRLLPPESLIHRIGLETETNRSPRLSTTRCEHLPINTTPLLTVPELHQLDGRLEATNSSLPYT